MATPFKCRDKYGISSHAIDGRNYLSLLEWMLIHVSENNSIKHIFCDKFFLFK